MKTEISIILSLSDVNSLEILTIQNNLSESGIKYNLILIGSTENQKTYSLFFNAKWVNTKNNEITTADFNNALKIVETPFVCYLPSFIHLNKNWLYDLFYYITTIDNSGMVSICSSLKKGFHNPLLNNYGKLISCYKPKYLCDLFLIHFDTIKLIGAFDNSLSLDKSIAAYSLKTLHKGLHIYNIPFQAAISVSSQPEINESELSNLKDKLNTSFVPLFKRSDNQEKAFTLLDNLVVALSCKTIIFEHISTANFGFFAEKLINLDIENIKNYTETFDLAFSISSDERNRLKVTFFN